MKRYKPMHQKKCLRIGIGRLSVICVFMIAAVVTISIGASFSKMTSSAKGNSGAQVAAFIVEADGGTEENVFLDCEKGMPQTATYSFAVTNAKNGKSAEVAMKYDVVITLKKALPEGLSMTIPTESGEISGSVSSDSLTYTFSDPEWVFAAGTAQTREHAVKITVQEEIMNATMGSTISLTGISVGVHAEQID